MGSWKLPVIHAERGNTSFPAQKPRVDPQPSRVKRRHAVAMAAQPGGIDWSETETRRGSWELRIRVAVLI